MLPAAALSRTTYLHARPFECVLWFTETDIMCICMHSVLSLYAIFAYSPFVCHFERKSTFCVLSVTYEVVSSALRDLVKCLSGCLEPCRTGP